VVDNHWWKLQEHRGRYLKACQLLLGLHASSGWCSGPRAPA
jgi:hypothetical protein